VLKNRTIEARWKANQYSVSTNQKKHTGTTIHQALMQEKITVAKTLLRNTSLSVNEVAAEVGFSDRTQFCTAFRKHTKYTPTEYQKNKSAL
jgi:AraC-like DNA-binding protein